MSVQAHTFNFLRPSLQPRQAFRVINQLWLIICSSFSYIWAFIVKFYPQIVGKGGLNTVME